MKLSHKLLLLACAASLVITQAAAAAEEDIWGDIEDDEAGGKKSDGKMTGNGKPKKDGEEEDNSPLSFFERHGMVFMYLAVMFVNKFIRGWLQKREAAAAEPGGLVKAIHSDAEWKEALEEWKKTNQLVIVDFSASWCGPCKAIAPEFERLSLKFSTTKFIKVDCEEVKAAPKALDVSSYPTFIMFRGAEKIGETSGAVADRIEALLKLKGAQEVPVEAPGPSTDKNTAEGKKE